MHLFFDHLVVFSKVEKKLGKNSKVIEDKTELWNLIDEIIQHRVICCVLEKLPAEDHNEFLEKFHSCPYEDAIMGYISIRSGQDITEYLKKELENLEDEILELIDG